MKKTFVLMAAAAAVLYSGMALAADWNFYGSARVETFFTDSDLTDSTNISESLQSNSRIGANVTVSDELAARFEYGAKDGGVTLRYLYGEWDFGSGKLLVGQYETPLYMPVSNQVYNGDNGLEGWGEASPGKHPEIQLTFGGLKIAAVSPSTKYLNHNAAKAIAAYDDTDLSEDDVEVKIPRIEISYTLTMNNCTLGIGGGYNSFEYKGAVGNLSEDIDSYAGVIMGKVTAGAFSLGGQAFMGQNVGNIIVANTTDNSYGNGYAMIKNNKVVDNDAAGFEVVAAYMVNEMISLEAGYGYMETEYDDAESDEVASYYLQAPITLTPGVIIVPEIGMVDYQENGQDEITYYGAKWQINF
ncbi:MAG: hypothetical protein HUN04_20830 [Desulfobacter sp.]|nr:MAG: hypothetical protein HUN04_20830 [Desulfobacter sp.]